MQPSSRKSPRSRAAVPLRCVHYGAFALVLCLLAAAGGAAPSFSLASVLSYPFPMTLVAAPDGGSIAYAIDQRGIRSIWLAQAPDYTARRLVIAGADDGQDFNDLALSRGAAHLVYVRGGAEGGPPPDPDAGPIQPHQTVWSVDVARGTQRRVGDGSAPAISPDGTRVAFERDGAVWSAPLDGSAPARRLFYDRGRDSDLQWAPSSDSLAFVSSRGDHAFIGVYRGARTPLEFLAPSTANDAEPRWSPDGTRIAFARTPGDGGALPSPLAPVVVPWSIWVARVKGGSAAPIWQSPRTPRASFPTQGGDVDLTWASGARLVFVCEMDDWPHLYSIAAGGGAARLLTPGAFSVGGVNVSADGRFAFYDANDGATAGDIDRWHLYRVDVTRGGNAALTSGTGSQWWATPLRDGKVAYVEATAQQPPLVNVASITGSGSPASHDGTSPSLHDARAVDAALLPADFPASQLATPRDVTFRARDGTLIHGQLFASPATAKRPGIVFVHGGPMRRMLLTWNPMDYYSNSYAVDQALVDRGFAVLSVNYRTGTGYGHDFHYALRAGWMGASEYQDVLAGARFLQREPSVDPSRIGIWGGSWGGYLTALSLARNSNVFKAGVDFHGVHDLTHDVGYYFGTSRTTYPIPDWQRWLKLAWDSSPDSGIATWRSPVLLIQGDDDRDVSFHQMVDVVQRLRAHHVPFEQMVLPDEVHGFLRYASWLRADQATIDFLQRHLER